VAEVAEVAEPGRLLLSSNPERVAARLRGRLELSADEAVIIELTG